MPLNPWPRVADNRAEPPGPPGAIPPLEEPMNGHDDIRGREYTALMGEVRDVERTAQFCWTAAVVAAAFLLSSAVTTHHPGLALPVQICATLGYFALTVARRRVAEIETYVRRVHEQAGDAQWFTTRRPTNGAAWQDVAALVIANVLNVTAIVFAWLNANVSPHADLVSGAVTLVGMAFMIHSLLERARGEAVAPSVPAAFTPPQQGLREVPPPWRTGSER